MPEPMIEHANATLEIVDLLQAMVGDCKCEAEHVLTRTGQPMGACTVLATHRSRHCDRTAWFLVCGEYVGFWDHQHANFPDWYCTLCGENCWELLPV